MPHPSAAVDLAPLFYLLIVVLWIGSAIRAARRAAVRQRLAAAATAGAPAPKQAYAPQDQADDVRRRLVLAMQRRAMPGQTAQPAPGMPAAVAPAARPAPPPRVPDVPTPLQLQDAVSAFGGPAVQASPAQAPQLATPQVTTLTPLTSANAVVNAIVGAAVLGPCAAYRTSDRDLIGW